MTTLLLTTVLVFAASWAASGLMTGWLRRRLILDHPVERSSHARPVPKGAGVAVTAVLLLAWLALAVAGLAPPETLLACCLAFALAALSWLNDVTHLPPALRLAVHLLIATVGLLTLPDRGQVFQGLLPRDLDQAATVLLWTWFMNLFNFMDGIDGIAASEATFIAWAGAFLARPVYGGASAAAIVLGAACLGFLRWNWAPARIFMGDVGSGYLGYVIAVLAVSLAHQTPPTLWVWLILGGVFFVDATVTLLQRLVRGRRVYQAHRDHVYQWLARRWHSHARATGVVLAVNLLWLFPCALLAARRPQFGAIIVLLAFLPLTWFALRTGGQRLEKP
jgi:Fuc2NAc and GlcNAc transferase